MLKQDWAYTSKGMTDLNCFFAKQASSNDVVMGKDTDSDQCLTPPLPGQKTGLPQLSILIYGSGNSTEYTR